MKKTPIVILKAEEIFAFKKALKVFFGFTAARYVENV